MNVNMSLLISTTAKVCAMYNFRIMLQFILYMTHLLRKQTVVFRYNFQ